MTAQTALLQAALGAPARLPVARLSDVVPRQDVRDLAATISAYREAREAQNEQSDARAVHLLTRVHEQAATLAYPATTTPPAAAAVLVVLPGAAGLAELLRIAVNQGDREVEGEHVAPFPPLHQLAPDNTDRRVLEAAARHLHALITTGVLADTTDQDDRRPDVDVEATENVEHRSAERSA